jgi:GAF domain-containing protein
VNQEISAYRQSLETRIEERTSVIEQRSQELITRTLELETANLQAERRNEQLMAIAAVSNAIAMLHNLGDMLPKITELISEKFGFYHVAIFLNDPSATLTMLKACNSAGGKDMLERGYNLKIDKTSIVGIVASTGRPYIALDSGNEFALTTTPDLPETRSELAVPLKFAGKTIGVLDVQSSQPNAFSPDDTQVLATLADQVSLAIQNAEFFENAQKSAAETQKLLRQYAREQWARITKVQKKIGYIYKGDFKPLDQKVLENSGQNPNRQIIPVPIMVRGQMIGTLAISAPKERNFSADEIDIIRAAAERTAIAAENARLLEDSQNRVIKEQTISSITSKIGASVNLHNILQTAVEEIGRIIPGSEVAIEIEKKAEE